jgi:MarR family transcriptional regulator, organic hydroperoxide resistance regulator
MIILLYVYAYNMIPKRKDRAVTNSQYPCFCALIRKAGRIATRNYDNILKPCRLKVTQFGMLANIARNPATTVSDLAELLSMDQTTVSRNLRVLGKFGYIRFKGEITDHRIRRIQISDLGVSKMNEARPLWEQAQLEMERVLGRKNIDVMIKSVKKLLK